VRRAAALLLLAALATAGEIDNLLDKARHAQLVQGDFEAAIRLYGKVLANRSLPVDQQATVRLRLAVCYVATKQPEKAKGHLAKHLFEGDKVPSAVRRQATELRFRIRENEPKPATRPAPREDPALLRRKRLRLAKQRARRYLRSGDLAKASYHVQAAVELAPEDEDVRALAAELETHLSGVMDFLKEPLQFVSRWAASRTRAVAREAQNLLRLALGHAEKRQYNLAARFFTEAVEAIDACEFARDSDELRDLRLTIRERWRASCPNALAPPRDSPAAPRRASLVAEYLNHLQRMLDLVSGPDREYRILRVGARRAGRETRGRVVPKRFSFFDHLPSRWTPARFASLYLPLRVHPDSWKQPGNYIEAAGGMLISRNHPRILDALAKAAARVEHPEVARLKARFLLVSVPRATLGAFEKQFGKWKLSRRGVSPLRYRVLARSYSLEYLGSFLRDEGVVVTREHDLFEIDLANGAAHNLFIGLPTTKTRAPEGAPVTATHYGLHLDTFAIRERDGRTAIAMKVASRYPAPALGDRTPRYLSQLGELFVDLPPGTTLAVGGLVDPFASGAGDDGRELLLLWRNTAAAGPAKSSDENQPGSRPAMGVEIPLRNLLIKVRDHPGPVADKNRGFVRRDRLEVLSARARFLENLLRDALGTEEIVIDEEAAVARIPPLLRERAADLVKQLERESARSYVVRVHTRSVPTRAFEQWMRLDQLRLKPFGAAWMTVKSDTTGGITLRKLAQSVNDDVFAPKKPWPAITIHGLQAGHALHTRRRTSPRFETDEDVAAREPRTIEEGTRVTVRPYAWGNRLRLHIEIELAGLQEEVEERALNAAVPSYRTAVAITRVVGSVELGDAHRTATLVVCRIPHPTASSTEALTEIVIAVDVRALR